MMEELAEPEVALKSDPLQVGWKVQCWLPDRQLEHRRVMPQPPARHSWKQTLARSLVPLMALSRKAVQRR